MPMRTTAAKDVGFIFMVVCFLAVGWMECGVEIGDRWEIYVMSRSRSQLYTR
jgi:hypothetical protein